ncbi:putative 2'-5' RNA ligase [Actinomyces johnsonii F0510]|uniref:Putative 2'-5' RNA ligase n=1 Tax=Actinomyces johnsonii F0510 TaxID=1227262 RepID=U1RVK7_9ACTO|nr:2'-5' RNA ligase family protein [Actinomyces johnsonii]ERH23693.1 putative 2'-5' RNA ligase [Actinomyces johnsonii F0510]
MQIPAPDAHQCVIGVAIALPSHYAAQVRAVREAAGDPMADVVPPHITLLPPTAVDVDSLDEVMRHLRNVAAGTQPFDVRLDQVGTFRPVSPVVYLSLRSGAQECDRLQMRVRDRRGPLARSLSFPFHPHVTLAHEVADEDLDLAAREGAELVMDFTVTKLHLYRHLERSLQPGRTDVEGAWEVAAAFAFGGSLVSVAETAEVGEVTGVPAASAPETTPVVSV